MRRRSALRSLAAGLVLIAGLAACASSGGSSGSEGTSGSAPTAATTPDPSAAPDNAPTDTGPVATTAPGTDAPVVPEVLDVQATLVGGGDIDLAAFAGKPLALWFWAPT